MKNLLAKFALSFSLLGLLTVGVQAREFTSANGSKIEGEIIKFEGEYITFKRSDGKLFRFKLEILSPADQTYVRQNFEKAIANVPTLSRPLSVTDVKRFAAEIDRVVEEKLAANGKTPNLMASDETFLRRAYLLIAGRIPTMTESEEFIRGGRKTTKKQELIDKLLNSEGHVSSEFHYWADILRAKSNLDGVRSGGVPYVDWIKKAIRQNLAYDKFVRELVSSTGPVFEKGNGPVGYYFRDRGMPLDNMANTVRIFLGTSLECAQCHNHPFDKWTQKDFYQMAAFTHGVGNLRNEATMEASKGLSNLIRNRNPDDVDLRRAARTIGDIIGHALDHGGAGKINLPDDYQYDDGKPKEEVMARTLFGPQVELDFKLEEINSRKAYANWLTSEENPRFTTVIANRMWKKAMGIGLIEPVDTMTDKTQATNPILMTYLENLMKGLSYDLREFQRVVYNTRTFQRRASKLEFDPGSKDPYLYPGPTLRRMSGEQIWDSLLVLTHTDVDNRKPDANIKQYDLYDKYKVMTADQLFKEAKTLAEESSKARERKKKMMGGDVPAGTKATNRKCPITDKPVKPGQIAMVEGKAIGFCCGGCQNKFMAKQETKKKPDDGKSAKGRFAGKEISNETCPFDGKKINRGQILENKGKLLAFCGGACKRKFLRFQIEEKPKGQAMANAMDAKPKVNRWEARSSELQSPAPGGHVIRQFGGSDREQIQNSNADASVTQVLTLLNGYVEDKLLKNTKSVLMNNIAKETKEADKIDAAFLSILNRFPTSIEDRNAGRALKEFGSEEAIPDIVWSLMNAHEFLFIQ
tara:strand:+ start:10594 stop:13017 length:2424 start_codon:yes stop_codon:yes gene_type:complete